MTENDERRLAGYRDFLSIDHGVTAPDVAFFMRLLDEATAALAQQDKRIRRLEAVVEAAAAYRRAEADAHREGWQAAIEAVKRLAQGDPVGAGDGNTRVARPITAADLRSLPYQPPEDRGDGKQEDRDA